MAKIEKLTPGQEAYLPIFREEWLQVGLSTERVDRDRATKAVKALYAAAGEEEPSVMHFDSPWQCIMAINFFRRFKAGAAIEANLRDNLGANLGDNLGANLGANLRDNLWDNLGANLRDNLWDNLGANLRANLRDNLWDNLWDNAKFVGTYFWGGQDAYWVAFYKFGQHIGVPYQKQDHLDAYVEFSKSCGWMYAYKGIAFVSDRPTIIKKDDEARLHNETGPSLAFADGYEMYSWHGVTIPAEWINDKSGITPKIALTWENLEQRRVAIEIVGWAKILRELDAKVIDADGDPQIGTLVEVKLPDLDVPARFSRVQCGTGREFAVGVPPTIKTAMEAQAWMSGLELHEFVKPEVRT